MIFRSKKKNKILIYIVIALMVSGLLGACNNPPSGKDNIAQTGMALNSFSLIMANNVSFDNALCTDNEQIILSFELEGTSKIISICEADHDEYYIVFRMGTSNEIDFEFPQNKEDSWNKFVYTYYLRGGGGFNEGLDLNYLSFEDEGKQYEVYQEYTAEQDIIMVGLKIVDLETSQETLLPGIGETVNGSLVSLRDNIKIKTE